MLYAAGPRLSHPKSVGVNSEQLFQGDSDPKVHSKMIIDAICNIK